MRQVRHCRQSRIGENGGCEFERDAVLDNIGGCFNLVPLELILAFIQEESSLMLSQARDGCAAIRTEIRSDQLSISVPEPFCQLVEVAERISRLWTRRGTLEKENASHQSLSSLTILCAGTPSMPRHRMWLLNSRL